ncbi:hypothetical protein KSC_102450 [Ktedonobacter sp. SOSP1-52]|nr:hypothetical protein KSC_102450 [Ktedonobacter sp. SOSP1-52]
MDLSLVEDRAARLMGGHTIFFLIEALSTNFSGIWHTCGFSMLTVALSQQVMVSVKSLKS